MRPSIPLPRKLAYTLVVLLCFAALLEIGARVVCFSLTSDGWALPRAMKYARRSFGQAAMGTRDLRASIQAKEKRFQRDLFTERGAGLLPQMAKRYEDSFEQLVSACQEWDCRLVVLYVPIPREGPPPAAEEWNRPFFRALTERHEIEFWDATETIKSHPPAAVSLLPEDAHLNGFGHQLLAGFLAEQMAGLSNVVTSSDYDADPIVFGSLAPNTDTIMKLGPPFRVKVNRHGCRGTRDLEHPKNRQRFVFLGDSFTFGNGVETFECYTEVLSRRHSQWEVLNCGRYGHSIPHQAALFRSRACHAAADVVVLQVLDNDVPDLFSYRVGGELEGEREYLESYLTPEEMDYLKRRAYW